LGFQKSAGGLKFHQKSIGTADGQAVDNPQMPLNEQDWKHREAASGYVQLGILLQVRDGVKGPELNDYPEEQQAYNAGLLIQDGYVNGKAVRGNNGQITGAIMVDLTSAGHDLLDEMQSERNPRMSGADIPACSICVFISHSSKDAAVAEALVDLLRTGIGLTEEEIRCTSVDGYRFEVGADTDTQLKQEVKGSLAFIGLITPSSIESAYVLFELGARWGADLHLAPVLARGADAECLRGPLSKLNALDAAEEPQVHQLLQDIAHKIDRSVRSPAVYGKALAKFVEAAKTIASVPKKTLADRPPVWGIREQLAPLLAQGYALKKRCGLFGKANIDYTAFTKEAHKWADEVKAILSAQAGNMAVVKFENTDYSAVTSNPGIGWDAFIFISARMAGLKHILNRLDEYVAPVS
jgi:TIR domain